MEFFDKLDKKYPDINMQYSAYKSDENDVPIDNLKEIALSGKVQIIQPVDSWSDNKKPYNSRRLINPTWLTLWKESDKLMRHTGDEHHCFFEGFDVKRIEDGVTIIELCTGS